MKTRQLYLTLIAALWCSALHASPMLRLVETKEQLTKIGAGVTSQMFDDSVSFAVEWKPVDREPGAAPARLDLLYAAGPDREWAEQLQVRFEIQADGVIRAAFSVPKGAIDFGSLIFRGPTNHEVYRLPLRTVVDDYPDLSDDPFAEPKKINKSN